LPAALIFRGVNAERSVAPVGCAAQDGGIERRRTVARSGPMRHFNGDTGANFHSWTAPLRAALTAGLLMTAASAGTASADPAERVTLRFEARYILESVARQMNVTLRPDEPLPEIHLESTTPLAQFQEAVAGQWKFRPPLFANVYVVARNEIYLTDDARYYRRLRRTLDESLAHEFAHYIQVRYLGANLADEGCEVEAVAVQFAFTDLNRMPGAPGDAG
jgi:hypothetical protein